MARERRGALRCGGTCECRHLLNPITAQFQHYCPKQGYDMKCGLNLSMANVSVISDATGHGKSKELR